MKKRADGRLQRTFSYNGKRYFVYGHNKKELDEKEHIKRLKLETKKDNRENPTLDQYHEKWERELAKSVKGSTIRSHGFRYKACANIVIESTGQRLGSMKLKEITVDDVREVQEGLQNGKRTTETVNNDIAHLSHIFHTAVKERVLDYNPCTPVKPLKRTEPEARDTIHRALTYEETDVFFKEAEKSFYYDVYRLALATGMRVGEIGAITQADLKGGFIHIHGTVTKDETGGNIVGDTPKTRRGDRKIPINDTIREIIEHQKEINKMLDGDKIVTMNDRIFKAPERGLLVCYPVDREIKRICKRTGIQHFAMHAFRDTFATRALEAGIDPRTLQELLGHSNFNLTMSLYGHVLNDRLEDAMRKIEKAAAPENEANCSQKCSQNKSEVGII